MFFRPPSSTEQESARTNAALCIRESGVNTMNKTNFSLFWVGLLLWMATTEIVSAADTVRSAECSAYLANRGQTQRRNSLSRIGSMLGKMAGDAVSKSTGVQDFSGLGVQVGAFVGGELASALDPCERDKAAVATQRALDSDGEGEQTTQTWQSDTNQGNSGSSTVTSQRVADDGQRCKTVRQVGYVSGKEVFQDVDYCQTSTGGWAPVQA